MISKSISLGGKLAAHVVFRTVRHSLARFFFGFMLYIALLAFSKRVSSKICFPVSLNLQP